MSKNFQFTQRNENIKALNVTKSYPPDASYAQNVQNSSVSE